MQFRVVGAWSLSQLPLGKRQGTLWIDYQSITGPHREKHNKHPRPLPLTRKVNLGSPINRTCMFLDGGRKLEYPPCTERTCVNNEHQPGFRTRNPLPVRESVRDKWEKPKPWAMNKVIHDAHGVLNALKQLQQRTLCTLHAHRAEKTGAAQFSLKNVLEMW